MKRLLVLFGLGLALNLPAFAQRVRLTLDTSEAEASLAVLKSESAHVVPPTAGWEAIFATTPYRLLKSRETAFNNTQFEEEFRAYLTSQQTIAQAGELRDTLQVWQQAHLEAAAERVLSYLPDGALIKARVYPVIKPANNSFVWASADEPAIFLYLNPALNTKQFENKRMSGKSLTFEI
jgi:hypothetical protein